jgi:hypothetical protein
MKRFAMALAALMLAAMPAKAANDITIGDLYAACRLDDQTSSSFVLCSAFVMGVGRTMLLVGALLAGAERRADTKTPLVAACLKTNGGSGNAMMQAFKNWAAKNPQRWGELAEIGVIIAIRETWPCK